MAVMIKATCQTCGKVRYWEDTADICEVCWECNGKITSEPVEVT